MSENTLKPQTTLRDYVIKRVLGRGSFGVTYLAEKIVEHYAVAIKEYLPLNVALRDKDGSTVNISKSSRGGREEFQSGLDKFLEESRTLSGLKSPHIVQVEDSFELNGTAYMVMKYEEGGTLDRYLEAHQEPLKESQIFSVFVPLLEGLRTIHAKWLLHRDIKPENIYIRKDGSPLLIDFGTARHALAAKRGGMTEYLTPGFAPPEQYDRNADHGPWTDIYAVGATMYYCVTRIKPYEGRFRTGENDPVISATRAAPAMYNKELLEIVDWMMKPDHDARPQSVDDVLVRLGDLKEATCQEANDSQPAQGQGKEGMPRKKAQSRRSKPGKKPRSKSTAKRAQKDKDEIEGKGSAAELPETRVRARSARKSRSERAESDVGTVVPTEVLETSTSRPRVADYKKLSLVAIGAVVAVAVVGLGLVINQTPTGDEPKETAVAKTSSETQEQVSENTLEDSSEQTTGDKNTETATPSTGEPEEMLEGSSEQTTGDENTEAATPATVGPEETLEDSSEQTAGEKNTEAATQVTDEPEETPVVKAPQVARATDTPQAPADSLSKPADDEATVSTVKEQESLEIALWNSVKNSNDVREIQAYIDRYPDGTFAGLARTRLADLESILVKDSLEVAVDGPEVVPLNRKTFFTINSNNAVKAQWSIGGFTNGWVDVNPMIDGHQIYIEPTDSSRVGDWFTLVFVVFDESGNSKKTRKRFQIGR